MARGNMCQSQLLALFSSPLERLISPKHPPSSPSARQKLMLDVASDSILTTPNHRQLVVAGFQEPPSPLPLGKKAN